MRKSLMFISLLGALGMLLWTAAGRCQEERPPSEDTFDNRPIVTVAPSVANPPVANPYRVSPPDQDAIVYDFPVAADPKLLTLTGQNRYSAAQPTGSVGLLTTKVYEILGRLHEADELHKPAIVKDLQAAVSEQFDEDMKHREAELTKLEERVAKLRAQFDRRRKVKAEITELHTKVLVNEAEGLGFSTTPSTGNLLPNTSPNHYQWGGTLMPQSVPTPAAPPAAGTTPQQPGRPR